MPLDKTVNEYKIAWLQAALASVKTNLIELEYLFYGANSGLTPVARFSVTDHKLAYLRSATSTFTSITITDVEIKYFLGRGAVGSAYDDLARNNWQTKPFSGGGAPSNLYDTALYDTALYA